jgi:NitT/TauT family transport system permease protein
MSFVSDSNTFEEPDRFARSLEIGQRFLSHFVVPLAFAAALFLVWEAVCRVFEISSFILPAPSRILPVLWENYEGIAVNARQTAFTTLIGFAIGTGLGLVLGAVVGATPDIYRAVYPTLIGFNTVPKVAVVPIFVAWLGYGSNIAIITAAITCLFPVLVVVSTAVATTEPELDDMLRSFGARKWDVLKKVSIPRAMPQFFGSINLAIVAAFIGTIIAEMIAANSGLGYVMVVASGNLDVPLVFAGLIVLAAMGLVLYFVAAFFERRMTGWAYRGGA